MHDLLHVLRIPSGDRQTDGQADGQTYTNRGRIKTLISTIHREGQATLLSGRVKQAPPTLTFRCQGA